MIQYIANMTGGKLKKLISKAPTGPGVYMFTGGRRKLYIGKASNLKARLSSYLKTTDQRILQMLSLATGVKTLETGSEIEALITESQYVKRYKPAFNIMLRDDKNFFYVDLTKEEWPKVFITHRPTLFGPFTDGTALKTTLRYLRRIFPYCTCKKPHNNFCLNYHIGKCFGFCCLKDNPEQSRRAAEIEYKRSIRAIKNILSGKKTSLLKGLEKEMIALGKKEEFEKAIELKNKIEKIKRVFENAKIIRDIGHKTLDKKNIYRIEGYDIANIQGKYAVGAMVVFSNGKPDKNEYRKFKIYSKQSSDDTAMLKEVLTRRFNHPEWPAPDLILIDGGKAQLSAALKVICTQIPVIALAKDEKHRGSKIFISGNKNSISLSKLPTDAKNLLLHVDSEAHRFAISYHRRLHRTAIK